MEILRPAMAGSIESNDILVKVSKNDGIEIDLKSDLEKQYGEDIENTILETIKEFGATNVLVEATDKGAIDFTIKARVMTALKRATKSE